MSNGIQKDLLVLAADKNMEAGLGGILGRPQHLGLRSFSLQIFVHPEHDPGCRAKAQDFARPFIKSHAYAIVVFDREGSGDDSRSRVELELGVEKQLAKNGWKDRSAAIVIDPELENWVWSDSRHVDIALGWHGKTPTLRDWLTQSGFLAAGNAKPPRPKEAVEGALRLVKKPRSSSMYLDLGKNVDASNCVDPAFQKLKETLVRWFPNRTIQTT